MRNRNEWPTFGFDIETCPLHEETIKQVVKPFQDEPYTPRADWKTETNEKKAMEHLEKAPEREAAYYAKKIEDAGLKASRSRVLCISYATSKEDAWVEWANNESEEAEVLERFWSRVNKTFAQGGEAVGFNVFRFDLRYLARRSLILGVPVELGAPMIDKRNNFHPNFVDIYEYWAMGERAPGGLPIINLHELSMTFGLGGKVDGMSGKHFWRVALEDRKRATNYAKDDAIKPLLLREAMKFQRRPQVRRPPLDTPETIPMHAEV